MSLPNPAIFTPLLIAALAFFAWSCYRRFSLILLGKHEERFDRPAERIWSMLVYAFGQLRVVQRPFGINHFIIFWAFMILLIANAEFLISGVFPGIRLSRLPAGLYHILLFAFDIVSILTLGSIALAFARRLFFVPLYLETDYLKAKSFDAFLILSFIGLLMIAYFGLHGAEIALGNEPVAAWMPVSAFISKMFLASPLAPSLVPIAWFSWWLHATVLLAFICYLPHSKHMHILTAIPNCFFRSLEKPVLLPREEFAKGEEYGAGRVDLFTWKDLFDSFACTECGRCQEACPATVTGKPLNPRAVVHDLKINLLKNASLLREGKAPELPMIGGAVEGSTALESIWACTTCGACLEACPVFIEQMPKIVKMRRHLVEEESSFPEELLNLFENMEQRSNPWGIAPAERTKWCTGMEARPFEAGKTEYLFFVGCSGAFDSRQKHVTVAIATLLNAAGISWGILGRDEKCCGDSLRRLGNEFVFDRIASENVQLFRDRGVTKIITQCPHCFSTLKNDYRQFGAELEVIHHSELLARLLAEGKLRPVRQAEFGKVVFHDSCYLGRHNGVYDPPRDAIRSATGNAPVEMERSRENSFCCGAGGGRMWMEEFIGTRINHARVKEALKPAPDTVCVSCPYCMTMFEDGLKDEGGGAVRVRDIAEVVAEALRPK